MSLANLRVATRIYGGFGIVLALLLAVGGLGLVKLQDANLAFDQENELAQNAVRIGRIDKDFVTMRRAVLAYVAYGRENDLKAANEFRKTLPPQIAEARDALRSPERQQMMGQIGTLADEYFKGLDTLVGLKTKAGELYEKQMNPVGLKMRTNLTEIIDTAMADKSFEVAAIAGKLQETLMLGRIEAVRFIGTPTEASARRATSFFDALDEMAASLILDLKDAKRLALAKEIQTAIPTYRNAFQAVVAATNESDTYLNKTLAAKGAEVTALSAKILNGHVEFMESFSHEKQTALSSTFTLVLVLVGIAVLMGIAAAVAIARGITVPVAAMTAAMGRLADKDWTTEVPAQDRGDEIGAMAKAVQVFKENGIENERLQRESEAARERQMAADEEKRRLEQQAAEAEARRQRDAEEAKHRAEEAERQAAEQRRLEQERLKAEAEAQRKAEMQALADGFEATVMAVVETVSSSATEMQGSSTALSATAEETSRQATAVAAASEQASANVQTVASATEELAASIAEITRQVAESSRTASEAVEQARATGATVDGLAQAAGKIGEVVELITSIASQTNLLALNATIEAARAGEAGKGFAVVASEVKSLANQTARATEEIAKQIGAVQSATGDAVSAIQAIGKSIERVSEIATTIASAVEEQGAATKEISRNVQEAASGTQEVSKNIGSVTEASSEVGAAATQMNGASGELARQAEILRSQVDAFIAKVRAA